ncbi:hypothetical protein LI90_300 [Carbonactinospora thermoautotrophica]|uniref:Uncharacterized protein n=1 Tax=Carbonactinospora thermoautotrophica TaxID=1469144 RepID=A0A132MLL5_9ACTN|nr:hypothetical protein LI90_300 [Carbonactinospora thermoautotrophica]
MGEVVELAGQGTGRDVVSAGEGQGWAAQVLQGGAQVVGEVLQVPARLAQDTLEDLADLALQSGQQAADDALQQLIQSLADRQPEALLRHRRQRTGGQGRRGQAQLGEHQALGDADRVGEPLQHLGNQPGGVGGIPWRRVCVSSHACDDTHTRRVGGTGLRHT